MCMRKGTTIALVTTLLLVLGQIPALAEAPIQSFDDYVKQVESLGDEHAVLYPVVFYTLAGTVYKTQDMAEGALLEEPDAPQVNGLAFARWQEISDPEAFFAFGEGVTRAMSFVPVYQVGDVEDVPLEEEAELSGTSILDLVVVSPAGPTPSPTPIVVPFATMEPDTPEEEPEEEVNLFDSLTSSLLGTMTAEDSTEEDILNMAAASMLDDGDLALFKGAESVEIDDEVIVSKLEDAQQAPATIPPHVTVSRLRIDQGEDSVVALKAVLVDAPAGAVASYQWQNDADGEFADVVGATGDMYMLTDEEEAAALNWRVQVFLTAEK